MWWESLFCSWTPTCSSFHFMSWKLLKKRLLLLELNLNGMWILTGSFWVFLKTNHRRNGPYQLFMFVRHSFVLDLNILLCCTAKCTEVKSVTEEMGNIFDSFLLCSVNRVGLLRQARTTHCRMIENWATFTDETFGKCSSVNDRNSVWLCPDRGSILSLCCYSSHMLRSPNFMVSVEQAENRQVCQVIEWVIKSRCWCWTTGKEPTKKKSRKALWVKNGGQIKHGL